MRLDAEGRDESMREADQNGMSPALRSMIAEVRAEERPEVQWDAVERKLMNRIARGQGGAREGRGGEALRTLIPLCAVAASIALALSFGAAPDTRGASGDAQARLVEVSSIAHAPGIAGDRGDRDLSLLQKGDAIESESESESENENASAPIAFARAGVVRWTLSPGSRVVVIDAGSKSGVGMTLSLERGSIRAEVAPRDPSEGLVDAFAVESGGTRVAVHGTAFTVTRETQSLVVDVEHGVVAVGPAGHRGVTAGYSLVGPSRASFSLNGAAQARFLPRDEEPSASPVIAQAAPRPSPAEALVAEARVEPHPSHPTERAIAPEPAGHAAFGAPATAPAAPAPIAAALPNEAAPGPAPAQAKPEEPPQAPEKPVVWLTASSIKSNIERCIKDAQRERLTAAKLSIASTFTISVDASGKVSAAKLEPPLAPHLRGCAGAGIAGKFASGPQQLTVSLSVVDE